MDGWTAGWLDMSGWDLGLEVPLAPAHIPTNHHHLLPPYAPTPPSADTFWKSVVQGAAAHETLQLEHPPTLYYSSHCEGLEKQRPLRLTAGRAQQQQAAAGHLPPAQPALTAA